MDSIKVLMDINTNFTLYVMVMGVVSNDPMLSCQTFSYRASMSLLILKYWTQ